MSRAYSDGLSSLDDSLTGEGVVLVKMHAPSPTLQAAILWSGGPVLLTVRDPRDCAVSLMAQFGHTFEQALHAITESGKVLVQLCKVAFPLTLKYEDGFAEDGAGIPAIAAHLDIAIDADDLAVLAARFSRQRVAELVATSDFQQTRDDRLPVPIAEPESEWHPNHIGDGASGKYRSLLAPQQIAALEYKNRDFMHRFGYETSAPAIGSGERIDCSLAGTGGHYLANGFSALEDWGTWTIARDAAIHVPLAQRIDAWLTVDLDLRVGPSLRSPERSARITVNGHSIDFATYRDSPTDWVRVIVSVVAAALHWHDSLVIGIATDLVSSPAEMGLVDDERRLGLGVGSITVGYA